MVCFITDDLNMYHSVVINMTRDMSVRYSTHGTFDQCNTLEERSVPQVQKR